MLSYSTMDMSTSLSIQLMCTTINQQDSIKPITIKTL
jgi:hypothetical protein